MAGAIETKIITRIENRFSNIYTVLTSSGKQETDLPIKGDRMLYRPDVILRDKKNGSVKYIIEIETDPVRKSILGACILADYCMGIDQPGDKPMLCFVIGNKYSEPGRKGLKQLEHFQRRGKVADNYLKNIYLPVCIDTEDEIVKRIL